MNNAICVPVLGFAAFSGTGKTTLLRKIIPLLRQQNLRLGLLKHSHHTFEIDKPGKDSYRLYLAGANQVLMASARRTVVMTRHAIDNQPRLADLLHRLDDNELDLLLVEGFKHHPIPKIELHRPDLGHPLICRNDPAVIAIATDAPLATDIALPVLNLNDPFAIADFIGDWYAMTKTDSYSANKSHMTGFKRA